MRIERSTGFYAADDVEVVLQYKRGSRWVNYKRDETNSRGKVKFKAIFGRPGKFRLRARVVADDYYAAALSKQVKVKVAR